MLSLAQISAFLLVLSAFGIGVPVISNIQAMLLASRSAPTQSSMPPTVPSQTTTPSFGGTGSEQDATTTESATTTEPIAQSVSPLFIEGFQIFGTEEDGVQTFYLDVTTNEPSAVLTLTPSEGVLGQPTIVDQSRGPISHYVSAGKLSADHVGTKVTWPSYGYQAPITGVVTGDSVSLTATDTNGDSATYWATVTSS